MIVFIESSTSVKLSSLFMMGQALFRSSPFRGDPVSRSHRGPLPHSIGTDQCRSNNHLLCFIAIHI